jgi:hypothetical protein
MRLPAIWDTCMEVGNTAWCLVLSWGASYGQD